MKKKFKSFLILNWKTGDIRTRKKKPKELGPYEIPISFDVDLEIPKNPDIAIRGSITVPETKVGEMVLDSI